MYYIYIFVLPYRIGFNPPKAWISRLTTVSVPVPSVNTAMSPSPTARALTVPPALSSPTKPTALSPSRWTNQKIFLPPAPLPPPQLLSHLSRSSTSLFRRRFRQDWVAKALFTDRHTSCMKCIYGFPISWFLLGKETRCLSKSLKKQSIKLKLFKLKDTNPQMQQLYFLFKPRFIMRDKHVHISELHHCVNL